MRQILIIIFGFLILSCSNGQDDKDIIINKLKNIDGWKIEFVKGETDTFRSENWLPKAELTVKFQNKHDINCLEPTFDFYPVELDTYIEKW